MQRLLNIHNVNCTLALKNYVSIFDGTGIRRHYKDNFTYINWDLMREANKER